MATYHIKTVKGRTEKIHPCDGYTVTTLPRQGHYAEHPEVIGMPEGQKVKIELDSGKNPAGKTLYYPRDGIIFVMNNNGKTIDTYPKKRERKLRNLDDVEGAAV